MKKKNRLYYFDTETEVLEGDRIVYKSILFRRKKLGRVSYIPKKTGRELQQLKKDCDDWLLEFNDKTVTGWFYSPEDLQPNKRLSFVSRQLDNYIGITTSELEKTEQKIIENTSWWESVFSFVLLVAIGFLVIFLLVTFLK